MRYPIDTRAWINRWFLLLPVLLFCLNAQPAFGQNRKELVEKRERLKREIEKTQRQLEETQENKEAALERYFALQNQIQRRQQLINTLQTEINYANESIERSHQVLDALNGDIDRLKTEYATMLRVAYRHRLNKSMLAFLFSANSLNDAFRRWQYIRQYDRFRNRQADLILETQEMLISKTEQLEQRRTEKEGLLSSEQKQKIILNRELADKDKLLENLKSNESQLVADLERQRQARDQLIAAIETIIRKEMERSKAEARQPNALTASNSEAAAALAGDFIRNKGRLPWPVENGRITRQFGTQPHPVINTIQITNNGIDIETDPRSEVHTVFKGRVAGTQFIPGYQYMVIIQHGEYYTVYSNLEEIYVKRGDQLEARMPLGRVGQQKNEMHFEVWREKQRLNPVHWVNQQ